jgi:hypothetical protein
MAAPSICPGAPERAGECVKVHGDDALSVGQGSLQAPRPRSSIVFKPDAGPECEDMGMDEHLHALT